MDLTNGIERLTSIEEFLEQFNSIHTREAYARDLQMFFVKFCNKPAEKVVKLDAISYMNWLERTKQSPASIARRYASLRSYFKFLVNIDAIDKSPFEVNIRMPHLNPKQEEGLKDEEVSLLFDVIPKNTWTGIRDMTMFCLMLYNGLRRGEVIRMCVGDFFQVDGKYVVRIYGKGAKERVRPAHKEVVKAMSRWARANWKKHKRTPCSTDAMFTTAYGNRVHETQIYRSLNKYARLAGVRRLYPHLLRAKFASMALESGVPITSLQEDLGHASIETTAIYDKGKRSLARSSVHRIRKIG